jgi:hypothetical protein
MGARDDRFDGIAIVRLTSWATAASIAVALAVLASLTPAGSQRIAAAVTAVAGGEARQSTHMLRQADIESDRRSLNEALRLLAADRDRLMARVGSIERNLDDITGSIRSQMATRPRAETTSLQDPANVEALPAITAKASPAKPRDLPDWLANVPQPWPSPSSAMEFAPGPSPGWSAPSVRVQW